MIHHLRVKYRRCLLLGYFKIGTQRKGNVTVRFELFVDLGAEHRITQSLAVASVHW
jgi:hypothetical protein